MSIKSVYFTHLIMLTQGSILPRVAHQIHRYHRHHSRVQDPAPVPRTRPRFRGYGVADAVEGGAPTQRQAESGDGHPPEGVWAQGGRAEAFTRAGAVQSETGQFCAASQGMYTVTVHRY